MHMIDESKGVPAIAYLGDEPWHRLGKPMQAGQSIEDWREGSGLDYDVLEAMVRFDIPAKDAAGNPVAVANSYPERKVLYRSDNQKPLSVMGRDFNVVQPRDIIKLYEEIAKASGFSLETAGALDSGRRVWALARVGEGADVVNRDRVRPYILLATSFDGSMATIAKFTAIRVVCHNTISMAVGSFDPQTGRVSGSAERDETAPGRQQVVRVLHSTKWNEEVAKNVRLELGIVHDEFERWTVEARALANRRMTDAQADEFLKLLLEPYRTKDSKVALEDTRGYKRVMELFKGAAIGADLVGDSRWAMLNAVSEFVDHERGRSDSSRLESAWFGTGNAIKTRAESLLQAA